VLAAAHDPGLLGVVLGEGEAVLEHRTYVRIRVQGVRWSASAALPLIDRRGYVLQHISASMRCVRLCAAGGRGGRLFPA
jgi:hypothetical protein